MLNIALSHSALCEKVEFSITEQSEHYAELGKFDNQSQKGDIILEIEICRIEPKDIDSDCQDIK